MNVLKNAKSVLEASNAILTQYEKPADQGAAVQAKRAEYGQGYYNKFAGKTTTAPVTPPTPAASVKVGGIVQFAGGGVYTSSNAATAAATKGASRCKVTQTYNGKHPYHLISEDGKGVYGWVDAAKITK